MALCLLSTFIAVCAVFYRSKQRSQEHLDNIEKNVSAEMHRKQQSRPQSAEESDAERDLPALPQSPKVSEGPDSSDFAMANGQRQRVRSRSEIGVPTVGGAAAAETTKGGGEDVGAEDVREWLRSTVGLEAYFSNFWENGYESLSVIKHISGEEELAEIGIDSPAHQMRLLAHINRL